jgi:AraC-like DNA-binding protein
MTDKKKEYALYGNNYSLLECSDLIVGDCNTFDLAAVEVGGRSVYCPYSVLYYIETGEMELQIEGTKQYFSEGGFYLIRKCTDAYFIPKSKPNNQVVRYYSMNLFSHVLIEVAAMVPILEGISKSDPLSRVLKLPKDSKLLGVIQELEKLMENNNNINKMDWEKLVLIVLHSIMESSPEYFKVVRGYSNYQRCDLELFMNRNFHFNYKLSQFSQLSGRSLSTFHREFKKIFHTTPHKWLLKKRLYWADTLLRTTSKSVSTIAYDSGFKDLAHFSKAYKNCFSVSPSVTGNSMKTEPKYSFFDPKKR